MGILQPELPPQRPNISLFVRIVGTISTRSKKCYNGLMDGLLDPSKLNL